ncbi:hypothetical protein ACIQC0_08585 [Pseudarthrobacter sp. NPDC092419]|uniref:hypothetical protein n=1 Tax=Pseudarthrobacter sp. NPDC092419 TaxID=3364414 RepID=UPI00380A9810
MTYELHGVRREGSEETDIQISVEERHDETFLEPRFRMVVSDAHATYIADVSTQYQISQAVGLSKPVVKEFIERVAIMAAFPFIRESIATTAARMELPVPVLGLLRAGSFSLDEGDT